MKILRDMVHSLQPLLPKGLFFFYLAGFGCFVPYANLFYRSRGMDSEQIGVLTAIVPLITFFVTPIWTMIADKTRKHKTILIATISIYSILQLFFLFIPPTSPEQRSIFGSHPLSSLPLPTARFLLFTLVILTSVLNSPIGPLIDSFALQVLGRENREFYGKQRLWGAIGWGFSSFFMGLIIDETSYDSIFIASLIFFIIFVAIVVTNPLSMESNSSIELVSMEEDLLENESNVETVNNIDEKGIAFEDPKYEFEKNSPGLSVPTDDVILVAKKGTPQKEVQAQSTFFQDICKLLFNFSMLSFLVVVLMISMVGYVISGFLFLYLKDHFNASTLLMGASMPFSVFLELPFFFFTKNLIKKMGVKGMIALAHVIYIIRVSLYYIIGHLNVSAWVDLPIELLHGFGFTMIWAAGVQYSSDIAPVGLEATAQGIYTAIWALGGIGGVIGGRLYTTWGPVKMFGACAPFLMFSLLFFVVTQFLIARSTNKQKEPQTKSTSIVVDSNEEE
eukprot:TRINITY_DN393_c0_g2_i1.p1 TRINITY_DN393_c0_g2~~TRINITY_DN393_c0_g2_i1.p1  ORF type:complete len:505 (+),score=70.00 TRINITY_DN393_c0_g2_i1:251-1765(+)